MVAAIEMGCFLLLLSFHAIWCILELIVTTFCGIPGVVLLPSPPLYTQYHSHSHSTCIANGCCTWDLIVLTFSFSCRSGLFECIANIINDLKYRLQMSSLPQPPCKYMQVAPSMPQRRSLQFVGGMVWRSNVKTTSPSASWKIAIMGAAQKETAKEEFVQASIASCPSYLENYW